MRLAATLVLLLALGTSGWTNEMKDLCGARAGCSCGWWGMQLVEICPGGVPKDEETVFDAEGKFGEHSEGAVSLACYRDLQEAVQKMVKVNAMLTMHDVFAKDGPFLYGQEILIRVLRAQIAGIDELAARCAPEKGKE